MLQPGHDNRASPEPYALRCNEDCKARWAVAQRILAAAATGDGGFVRRLPRQRRGAAAPASAIVADGGFQAAPNTAHLTMGEFIHLPGTVPGEKLATAPAYCFEIGAR